MQVKDLIVTGDAKVVGKLSGNLQSPTVYGTIRIKPGTAGNWTEGLCINDANNGWTSLRLGGTQQEGTSENSWSIHTYNKNFYIAHNGSSESTTGFLSSDANGNWTIKNSIRVGAAQAAGSSILRNSRLVSTPTNPTVEGEICWRYQ
jgi:hypothetical protein